MDRRLWTPIHEDLAEQGFDAFLRRLERTQREEATHKEITAARAQQLVLFPGFENLPARIRIGSSFVKLPETSVSQFLAYETAQQEKAIRNRQRAEELHRLAGKVRQCAPEMALAEAFARAEAQAAKLHTVTQIA